MATKDLTNPAPLRISHIYATEFMSSLSFNLVKNKTCDSFVKQEWIGTDILEDNELENTIFNRVLCGCIANWSLTFISYGSISARSFLLVYCYIFNIKK